ncbi:DUF3168 domain-containing protein [Euryhalocaulis caribicus]|uniref:DUF3168 domain-containing protein n=1 Tax=Euryhalocaulis caribicus TaxID=1161401 RepID=UPI000399ED0F|nr:DUF3168 domain-containing protein [Euryhalocaulis caribicus]
MPADHSLKLRQAIVSRLLADAAVSDAVEARVYGLRTPATRKFPFIRYDGPIAAPFEATGHHDGSEHDVTLHAFTKGEDEDDCHALAAAIVASLSADTLPLDGLGLISLDWLDTQVIVDGDDTQAFHAIIRLEATTTVLAE